MKKLALIFGIIFILFLSVCIIVPLVVDVDHYRPKIVEMANQQINGELQLGKLSLSLWGHIQIQVDGIKLADAQGKEVVSAKNAFFHLPFLSILSGAPVLTFNMDHPLVNVVKNRAGKINLLGLVRESAVVDAADEQAAATEDEKRTAANYPATAEDEERTEANHSAGKLNRSTKPGTDAGKAKPVGPPGGQTPAASASKPAEPVRDFVVPSFLAKARLGVQLKDALLTYSDQTSGVNTQVKDMNLILKDLSFSHPTELEFWADLDTQVGKTLRMNGAARLTGRAEPHLVDGKIQDVKLTAHLDMDPVAIVVTDLFEKKKGHPTSADLTLVASTQRVTIDQFIVRFLNAEIQGDAKVDLQTKTPVVKFKMKSNSIDFSKWVEAIPMLADYNLKGSAVLRADAQGPTDHLEYDAQLSFKGVSAKVPQFKTAPELNGEVHVMTDQVDEILVNLTAPGSDLKIQGKVVSFTRPKANFQVTSNSLDLDQWIDFPPPGAKSKSTAASDHGADVDNSNGRPDEESSEAGSEKSGKSSGKKSGGKKTGEADYDAQLATLRENEWAKKSTFRLGVNLKSVKAAQVSVTQIACQASFDQLNVDIDPCSFRLFGGEIKPSMHLQLAPKTPTYQWSASVQKFDLAQAIASQVAMFKNTLTGKANLTLKGSGSSFNPQPATAHLKMDGHLQIDQANFVTIDIAKMVSEALNQSLSKIAGQIPGLQGKKLPDLPAHSSKYEVISSHFSIQNGKFAAPDFAAKAIANQGIDLKGSTSANLLDETLDVSWDVIDTYNLTHAKDLSVEQSGVKVEHILADGSSPVHFPIHVGCKMSAPCYSYSEVPLFLSKIVLGNVSRAVTGKAKEKLHEELQKRGSSIIEQVAPPSIQNQLKNGLKGLFK